MEHDAYAGLFDMPDFRDPDGGVWVWDAESKTMVYKPKHDQRPDRGHATGGDNDLFDPFQHTEESGVPELEGYMASFDDEVPDAPPSWLDGYRCPHCGSDETQAAGSRSPIKGIWDCFNCHRTFHPDDLNNSNFTFPEEWNHGDNDDWSKKANGSELLPKNTDAWSPRGQVNCPNCRASTDERVCPQCGKDLTPEWNRSDDRSNEFLDVHVPFDTRNEFISDPERTPKRNQLKTDDSYPSMNLSHIEPVTNVKPQFFSSFAEELAWREANDASLDECPECHDTLHDQDDEKVCHACGHKQKIITAGAAAIAAPELLEAGGLGAEGMGAGGMGLMEGGQPGGLPGVGMLMNKALHPGNPQQPADAAPPASPYMAPGVVSKQAGIVGDLVEYLVGKLKAAPQALVDPSNPLSYADDAAGALASGLSGQQHQAKGTFGEEEVGRATKNDGQNSDPDQQSSSGDDPKEFGDSPEQLKDIDGIGGPTSGDEDDQLNDEGGADVQDKALKAFHLNKPLVIEFANSDDSGADNPILLALDALLEEAFPGYRDGTGESDTEHPLEEGDDDAPSEDESGENPEEGDSKEDDKASQAKEASSWAKQGVWAAIHEAGATPFSAPTQDMGSGAPGIAGANPPCPTCGQSHAPGTPCPQDASQFTPQPMANGAPISPTPPPNTVTTSAKLAKWEIVSYGGPVTTEPAPSAMQTAAPPCPNCGGQGQAIGMGNGQMQYRCSNCGDTYTQTGSIGGGGSSIDQPTQGLISGPTPAVHASVDDEFGFYALAEHAPTHHHGDDWIDITGNPLKEGHDYDLISHDYAIPDKVTVNQIFPDKISYTIHASPADPSSLPYHSELTKQDLSTMGYQFSPTVAAGHPGDTDDEHPVRPGQDATPQVDDLSTPSTVVSNVQGHAEYRGSYAGDSPTERSWVLEAGPGQSVAVDPALMEKFAGANYTGQEQRSFIDEDGVARNLDKLDLEGTHYLEDDIDNAFNW